ncbi:MAG: acyl-CoA dehydrogenase family protein [Candidatus Nezhaarchaeota archaeon]|nr:acyl-CoA dehydrogenase family protein [Candidatus Nezhaarchaeota archaeon]
MFELPEELRLLKRAVREWSLKKFDPNLAIELEKKEEFPFELWREANKLGFLNVRFPMEYGGQGMGVLADAIVTEELCRVDSTLGTAIVLGNFSSDCILLFGTEEQKERYLPRVTSGDWISSGAYTEPAHGSDITLLDTRAVKEGGNWIINGSKTFITNAPIAAFFVVLCQTDPEARHKGQTMFIVERGDPGIEITAMHGKLGIRCSLTGEVSFSDCKIPEDRLLGKLNRGFYQFMEFLDKSRIQVAAQAVGIAQGAFDIAWKYANERTAFGQKLIDFQAISHKLAEMAIKIDAARLLTYRAAWYYDRGVIDPALVSMAKAYAARVAVEVTDYAIQILGGYGYFTEYKVERYHRDAKITDIYEGTTEINMNVLINFLSKSSVLKTFMIS